MELNAVQTRIFSKSKELTSISVSAESENGLTAPATPETITPEIALEILKSEPDHDKLVIVLQWFSRVLRTSPSATSTPNTTNDFDFNLSSPVSSHIISILVKDILPAHWPFNHFDAKATKQHDRLRSPLLKCLRNVPGLRALLNTLRQLLDQARGPKLGHGANGAAQTNKQRIALLIEVLQGLLKGDQFLAGIWRDINGATSNAATHSDLKSEAEDSSVGGLEKQTVSLLWNDLLALLKGGKVVSAVAEAERSEVKVGRDGGSWVGNGEKYGEWLGKNVWFMVAHGDADEVKAAARVLESGLMLGYNGE